MKILCFGDSNTYGYDPRSYFGGRYSSENRWVEILPIKLGCETVNAGENGREIPRREGELLRFQQMLSKQEPDLLIIMLGGNDLLQGNSVEKVLERMETFLGHIPEEKAQILLIGPPPVKLGEWVPNQSLIQASKELNEGYQMLAKRIGIHFANAEEWNIDLTFDGVHFTEEGHRAFAEGLYNWLNRNIGLSE